MRSDARLWPSGSRTARHSRDQPSARRSLRRLNPCVAPPSPSRWRARNSRARCRNPSPAAFRATELAR